MNKNFIKLTKYFGPNELVWINSSMIQSVEVKSGPMEGEKYTIVCLSSGQSHRVKEKPSEILDINNELLSE